MVRRMSNIAGSRRADAHESWRPTPYISYSLTLHVISSVVVCILGDSLNGFVQANAVGTAEQARLKEGGPFLGHPLSGLVVFSLRLLSRAGMHGVMDIGLVGFTASKLYRGFYIVR